MNDIERREMQELVEALPIDPGKPVRIERVCLRCGRPEPEWAAAYCNGARYGHHTYH